MAGVLSNALDALRNVLADGRRRAMIVRGGAVALAVLCVGTAVLWAIGRDAPEPAPETADAGGAKNRIGEKPERKPSRGSKRAPSRRLAETPPAAATLPPADPAAAPVDVAGDPSLVAGSPADASTSANAEPSAPSVGDASSTSGAASTPETVTTTAPDPYPPQRTVTTTAPPERAVKAPAVRGSIESSIGSTLRVAGQDGAADYYNFYQDGTYLRRRALGGRDGGVWSRSGLTICMVPDNEPRNCFWDGAPRRIGETWSRPDRQGRVVTYTILPGFAAATAPPRIEQPRWISRPTGAQIAAFYPRRALDRGRDGRVVLDCVVHVSGPPDCTVQSETPSGWGFGDAAIGISQRHFRMTPRMENGRPTDGGRMTVSIDFSLN